VSELSRAGASIRDICKALGLKRTLVHEYVKTLSGKRGA
jgi:DNA-binding IclR family transcriptional regulator